MIVCSTAQGFRHVTQADHARFAADLLGLFRVPELVGHRRREALLRAVADHDNGWWEADAAPRLAASRTSALDFRAIPADLRQEIWQRGVERFAAEEPYVAALLAGHALRLSRHWEEDPSWASFRAALSARRDELLAAAGEVAAEVAADDGWLALADALSLAVCAGEPAFVDLPGWRLELRASPGGTHADLADGGTDGLAVALEPFPFAGATAFELSCRWLPGETFDSAAALGVALATSPWRRLRARFVPF